MAERGLSAATAASSLTLIYGASSLKLDAEQKSVSLGRDAGNDLMVPDKMASRVHCKIEFRRGNFFLVDQSTNGTYVTLAGDAEVLLKREQIMLRGHGVICLGQASASKDAQRVTFTSA